MGTWRHSPAEESVRRQWHVPETLLRDIGLKPGMVFMDIGCGEGFFTIPAAEITGSQGKVYAVDSDAMAIDNLRSKVSRKGLSNVIAEVGTAEETVFCAGCSDIVFFSMVLHDFRDPEKVLQNARQMIKPSGRLVNLDWKKKRSFLGPPLNVRFSEDKAQNLIEAASFKVEGVKDAGKNHYLITAKP